MVTDRACDMRTTYYFSVCGSISIVCLKLWKIKLIILNYLVLSDYKKYLITKTIAKSFSHNYSYNYNTYIICYILHDAKDCTVIVMMLL